MWHLSYLIMYIKFFQIFVAAIEFQVKQKLIKITYNLLREFNLK